MRPITIAILSAWLLSAVPAQADGWCWASRLTCPDCEQRQTWTPRERWDTDRIKSEAYHEIFGDGPRRSGRRRRKKAAPKAAAAPASPAPTAPPADAAAAPADAAPPPPADGAAQK